MRREFNKKKKCRAIKYQAHELGADEDEPLGSSPN